MKNMTLEHIAIACGGTYYGSEEAKTTEIQGAVTDSRQVGEDYLFIPVRGAKVDGHSFIPAVFAQGAAAVLSEEVLTDPAGPYILVDSTLQALKDIAEYYRSQLTIPIVGIAGSVGKTSTKEMIASVLEQKFRVLKTEGNFNNEVGLPLTILKIREEHEVAVLEMGISHFGEMTRLAKMARPDICVLTNIGCAHLEHLQSRDGILKAKTEMFQYMNPNGTIIFNGDDDKLISFVPENKIKPIYFGFDDSLNYHADDIEDMGMRGTTAKFITPSSEFTAHITIPGEHMVYNALAGIAVGYALGMTDDEIKRGIEALVPLAGRNHLIETENLTIIDDCYNANPASMKASLDVLAKADTRTVAILGDMFELGDDADAMHYEVGAHAAQIGINVVISIGEYTRFLSSGAKNQNKGTEVHHYATKADFFKEMKNVIKPHDTILIKASHGMEFPEIVEKCEAF